METFTFNLLTDLYVTVDELYHIVVMSFILALFQTNG